MQHFGEKVKWVRVAKGMRQLELAKASQTSKQYISKIESGKAGSVGHHIVVRLADALEVSVEWLLNGELQPDETWRQVTSRECLLRLLRREPHLARGATERLLVATRDRAVPVTEEQWRRFLKLERYMNPGDSDLADPSN